MLRSRRLVRQFDRGNTDIDLLMQVPFDQAHAITDQQGQHQGFDKDAGQQQLDAQGAPQLGKNHSLCPNNTRVNATNGSKAATSSGRTGT